MLYQLVESQLGWRRVVGVDVPLALLLMLVLLLLAGLTAVVVTVMLGSVAGRVILGHPPTLTSGILGLATLFILEAVFGQLSSSMRVHKLMNSPARLLMIGAEIQEKTLKRSHITIWELHGALRRAGVRSYEEIACVLHEPGVQLAHALGEETQQAVGDRLGGEHDLPEHGGRNHADLAAGERRDVR